MTLFMIHQNFVAHTICSIMIRMEWNIIIIIIINLNLNIHIF